MADISVNKPDLKMSQAEIDSTEKNTLETVLKSLLATKIEKSAFLPCLDHGTNTQGTVLSNGPARDVTIAPNITLRLGPGSALQVKLFL